jgi:hypothetical protein
MRISGLRFLHTVWPQRRPALRTRFCQPDFPSRSYLVDQLKLVTAHPFFDIHHDQQAVICRCHA